MTPLVDELRNIVGPDACLSRPEELFVYECDGLTLEPMLPSAVVLPRETSEIVELVKACRRYDTPFVPRGAGTGLSGGAHAKSGAVIIETSRMNRILEVDVENRIARVQPGVVNLHLSDAVACDGLYYRSSS